MNIHKLKKYSSPFLTMISLVLCGIIANFLYKALRRIQFQEVLAAILEISPWQVFMGLILTMGNYFFLAMYDFMGLQYLHQKLSWKKIFASSFLSYSFNFNLGAWVGGIAFRYRIYSGLGVKTLKITKLAAFCIVTSWGGYLLLLGALLLGLPSAFTHILSFSPAILRTWGILLMLLPLFYLYSCYLFKKTYFIKGHPFNFPSVKLAFFQLALSTIQWMVPSTMIYLLQGPSAKMAFMEILTTYLFSTIFVVVTHIPSGLGVLEASFIKFLSDKTPLSSLLAAILLFRTFYFYLPLLLAIPLYGFIEFKREKYLQTPKMT